MSSKVVEQDGQFFTVISVARPGKPCKGDAAAVSPPSLISRGISYAAALARWVAAGRPKRGRRERRRIFEEICKPCENYLPEPTGCGGRCRLCGCALNINKQKLLWATEECPASPPRWHAAAGPLAGMETKIEGPKMQEAETRALTGDAAEAAIEAAEEAEELAEHPGGKVITPTKILSIHPPTYPHDPLTVWDRWGNKSDGLRDLWRGAAGFLVCGGPSLKQIPLERLKDRGIVSLGVNNVAGYAPVRAVTFSDPVEKFHHGVMLDPAMLKFVPLPRARDAVAVKQPDGSFSWTDMTLADCPNVWAFDRNCEWEPEKFLTSTSATWGNNSEAVVKNKKRKIIFTFFIGLRLMHYLGVRRVYLLGVDFAMRPEPGGGYAFNEKRDAGACRGNNDHYKLANEMLCELKPYLDAGGYEIFNCNKLSALEAFPFVDFEEAYRDCRGNVPPEPFDLMGWYEKVLSKDGGTGRKAAKRAAGAKRGNVEHVGKKKKGQPAEQPREIKEIHPAGRIADASKEIEARRESAEKAVAAKQTRAERIAARRARREARAARKAARAANGRNGG